MGFNWTISRITVSKDEMKAVQDNSFGLTSPNINWLFILVYAVNIISSETTGNGKLSHVVQIDVRRFP